MRKFVIRPLERKSVEEITAWGKDTKIIRYKERFRWGSWSLEANEAPDIDLTGSAPLDLYESGLSWESEGKDEMTDTSWDFWGGVDDEERAQIMDIYERAMESDCYNEELENELEDCGWESLGYKVILYGPLELKECSEDD